MNDKEASAAVLLKTPAIESSIKHPLFTVNEHSPPCCLCGGSIGGATPANQIIPLVERGERVEYNP